MSVSTSDKVEAKDAERAESPEERPDMDDTPPVLGSWKNIYLFVMVVWILLVIIFQYLTSTYS
ncbi:MAG TPA: hypothetical protein DCE42_02380 [Myxococcales bacterium]|nr:hypothetical protein [Deltaproteobacteria bacterium]MBU49197.1 hypothetical protein [Deltaproteobacteria bacterium]HAA53571.1 hypothetical protein [Myxococcales bacterium]